MDCIWVQISSQGMIMGEGRRRGYNEFSLRMSSSLSKRWVCVVENLYRVFISEWPPLHLWVIRVYIVWVKGMKVLPKNPPGRMFRDCLAEGLSHETLAKTIAWHDFSASSHVLLTCSFVA